MKILLAGNPNSGKSTIFNALTGGHARTGNWHGVTVGMQCGRADLCGLRAEICDLPGIYSLRSYSMEENVARSAIEGGEHDLTACVADALTLARALPLIGGALRTAKRAALVVTMADALRKRGGYLHAGGLAARLGIPVICIDARKKSDIARLRTFLANACRAAPLAAGREKPTESLLQGVYAAGTAKESRSERLLYDPRFAFPLFFASMLGVFFLAFGANMPGTLLKSLLERLLSDGAGGALAAAVRRAGAPVAAEFVRSLFSGVGMLLSFLPQIAILYFALFLLEESGVMSALAFMTDGIFARVGLTGRAAFSVFMGFGCTAAAILTTRGLENKQLQKRVILILTYVSCSAKMPVYLAMLSSFFTDSFLALLAIYAAGVLFSLAAALALKAVIRGGEEFVLEIARPQFPCLRLVFKSLLFSLKQFIIKIATVVAAFLVLMWFLLSFTFSLSYVGVGSGESIMAVLCRALRFLFYPMGIRDWQTALAAVSGLVAKESVAGMLALFYGNDLSAAMSAPSAVAFILFVMTCSPCVSAIAAASREVGKKRAAAYAAGQTAFAFLFSYAAYGLLCAGALAAALLSAVLLAAGTVYLAAGYLRHEKIRRARRADASGLHRRKLSAGLFRLFAPSARKGGARQRQKDGGKRHAPRGRRDRVLHDPQRGRAPLLRRRIRRRKRARRR